MDEIAPEYDVVVLGTGTHPGILQDACSETDCCKGLTECVLSGYLQSARSRFCRVLTAMGAVL